jgi:hypothetical protein
MLRADVPSSTAATTNRRPDESGGSADHLLHDRTGRHIGHKEIE